MKRPADGGLQRRRRWYQTGFFLLFLLAPPLDLFRLDLNLGHFILFGQPWTLGLDSFLRGESGPADAALNLFLRGFLPIVLGAVALIYTAWRWGRLYCGWLCPHFSVVEMINGLMIRASGRPSIWEVKPLPRRLPDGSERREHPAWWPATWLVALFFAFLWAVTLLTYLLPPAEIWSNLFTGRLTPNQFRFLLVGTGLLFIEFMFARHLFCRFGCAVGLFQSLAWMGNERAMVVGFDVGGASNCVGCEQSCDAACPMRLKPRAQKRKMFTCTECGQCVSACSEVMQGRPGGTLLRWVEGEAAAKVAAGPKDHAPGKARPRH